MQCTPAIRLWLALVPLLTSARDNTAAWWVVGTVRELYVRNGVCTCPLNDAAYGQLDNAPAVVLLRRALLYYERYYMQ